MMSNMSEGPVLAARLAGKVALVTGAGRGIGRGVALAFASESARVVLADIDSAAATASAELARARGADALGMQCDVGAADDVHSCVRMAVEEFGRLDVLANAAITHTPLQPIEAERWEDVERRWRVDYFGTLHCMRAALAHLRVRGGSIINFGSGAAIEGAAGLGQYVPAKEAIRALSRMAAREWGPFGVRVNVIVPFAATPAHESFARDHPERLATLLSRTALGRVGDPELDVGRAAVFLASDDAAYITGDTLMVDGGKLIR